MNTNEYEFGYGKANVAMFQQRRTIDSYYGAFLQPYLKKGQAVLDCGCGPGTLTMGIAKFVAPGKVTAIDISKEQLELARNNIGAFCPNINFQQADINKLPFADDSFDAVFAHAVLCHLKNPAEAIAEQKRVLKSNGILALADGAQEALIYPKNKLLDEAFAFYLQPTKENGDIYLGLKHGQLLANAGFKKIKHEICAGNWEVKEISNYMIQSLETSVYVKKLLHEGKKSQKRINVYKQAWEDFANTKGALFCFLWGHAVGLNSATN